MKPIMPGTHDVVLADVDFIRKSVNRNNQNVDYEMLIKYLDAQHNFAFIGQNISVENVQPLENFRTRLAMIGWKVMSYRFNRRSGDEPCPGAAIAATMAVLQVKSFNAVLLITGDRGIIPALELMKNPNINVNVITEASWANDPLALQVFDSILPIENFIDYAPVLSGGKWSIEEEFKA